jgi:hypothetical protein
VSAGLHGGVPTCSMAKSASGPLSCARRRRLSVSMRLRTDGDRKITANNDQHTPRAALLLQHATEIASLGLVNARMHIMVAQGPCDTLARLHISEAGACRREELMLRSVKTYLDDRMCVTVAAAAAACHPSDCHDPLLHRQLSEHQEVHPRQHSTEYACCRRCCPAAQTGPGLHYLLPEALRGLLAATAPLASSADIHTARGRHRHLLDDCLTHRQHTRLPACATVSMCLLKTAAGRQLPPLTAAGPGPALVTSVTSCTDVMNVYNNV